MYVVGFNDRNRGTMYHFDGTAWNHVPLATIDGGNIAGPISLSDIFGFGRSDVYAVGERYAINPNPPPNFSDTSLIIHFDGNQWRDVGARQGRYLTDIAGNSSRKAWAVGLIKVVFQFDGTRWNKDSIEIGVPSDAFFGMYSITVAENGDTSKCICSGLFLFLQT